MGFGYCEGFILRVINDFHYLYLWANTSVMINGCGGRRGRDLILLTIVMILVNVRRLNPNPEGINWKLVWKLNVQQRSKFHMENHFFMLVNFRWVVVLERCPLCHDKQSCPFARNVWCLSSVGSNHIFAIPINVVEPFTSPRWEKNDKRVRNYYFVVHLEKIEMMWCEMVGAS